MSLSSAVVSTGVSDAVGSSKMTIAVRNGQRPGDLRQLALRDRQPLDRHGHRRLDAEHAHRLGRAPVHLPVVDASPRRTSRPRNMFSAIDRSGASMISWCTSTMPRRSASTGP